MQSFADTAKPKSHRDQYLDKNEDYFKKINYTSISALVHFRTGCLKFN